MFQTPESIEDYVRLIKDGTIFSQAGYGDGAMI